MKIKPEHLAIMRTAIDKALDALPNSREVYHRDYIAAGRSEKSFCWDVLRLAKIDGDSMRWLCDTLYPYLNDTHIDTALKYILTH